MHDNTLRRFFRVMNRYFMAPAFRLGLGPLLANPLSGYIMVLKIVGRKTGKTRYAPVNYTLHNGCLYCLSGFRGKSDWVLNLLAQPEIEVILPGRAIAGRAEIISSADERRQVARRILINAGFAGFMEGYNPRKKTDAQVEQLMEGRSIIRIQPTGIGSGPFDAGGWGWISAHAVLIALVIWLVLALISR